ncbi:MAG: helix-turn-helix domain-containing protein [Metallibacterium scheffleri]|jgi:CRP/FNR family transcriptional regulator|uniref:Crp/Fnr family transcriptional regulator n=1 Tax=Metallibacterium scheffleri TaxID=993689 RepID=UPI0026F37964|nr:helix-turn-helix domain-containing protein [Metallibacterium scheffleri]MCK9366380.1 helix-turn-helix domain-containing protein [Metallibacterium scheffleri]
MTAKPKLCALDVPGMACAEPRDARVSCDRCGLVHACGMSGNGSVAFADMRKLVEDIGPFRSNDHVFKSGEPFRTLFAVKSGMVKTVQVDAEGRAQVLGFYLPGEVVGLEAVDPGVYPCDGVALESTRLCKLSFDAVSHVAQREPEVQQHLFRMFSHAIAQHEGRSWDMGADQRVAAFLLDLSARYALRGLSPEHFHLPMPRSDIANFLHLAAETVSRVLARFREQGMVDIIGREVHLQQPAALRALLKDDNA